MTKRLAGIFSWLQQHWKLVGIIVLVLAGGGWWLVSRNQTDTAQLIFIKPERKNLVKTLEVAGIVDAKEKARLRFAAGGKVVYIGAKEGDVVKKYQTLATIDRAALQKQLQQDLNLYMKERYDWEQTKDDVKDKALNVSETRSKDKNQLDLNNTVLNVEIQSIAIQNTALTAPFEGILTVSPAVSTGIQLIASDYFEIVNPKSLEFIADVDEADIAQVQTGQTAELVLDAYPDDKITTFVGPVSFASKQGENGTVFEVTFMLNQGDFSKPLRLGLNGDIAIELDSRTDVLSVPLIATRQRDGKTYVDVRTGETTYEEREITVGLETDESIEVLSGLQEQDEILSPE
jgi:macrolide-specific efflux system membrane fusion protein